MFRASHGIVDCRRTRRRRAAATRAAGRVASDLPRRPSRVLLTNDDGVDSSLLVPLIEALYDAVGGRDRLVLEVLVPDSERSWSSKVMSRFNEVEMRATTRRARRTPPGTP